MGRVTRSRAEALLSAPAPDGLATLARWSDSIRGRLRYTVGARRRNIHTGIMKPLMMGLVIGVLAAGCTGGAVPQHSLVHAARHGGIVRVELVPIPEGNPAPSFEISPPSGDPRARPLGDVRSYIPEPLPGPLAQPDDCSFGGDLVVTFADGSKVRYGPCERPGAINRLWAAMTYVLTPDCAPHCGPNGEPPPQVMLGSQ
jgi:hypothetical protein